MQIRWLFSAFLVGLFGLRASGGVQVPEIISISRTSPATLSAPGALSLAFERTGGNGAATNLVAAYENANGVSLGVSLVNPPVQGGLSLAVSGEFENGTYSPTAITIEDAWGRTVTYLPDGKVRATTYGSNPFGAAVLDLPATHAINFAALAFTISGGVPKIAPPRLSTISRTSPAAVSPGATARIGFTVSPGSSAVKRAEFLFRCGTGATTYSKTVLVDLAGASGAVDIPISADIGNGPIILESLRLIDANGRQANYSRSFTTISDAGFGSAPTPATHTHDFAALDFTVSGSVLSTQPATLSLARRGGGNLRPGDTLDFTYETAGGFSPVRSVTFMVSGPFGAVALITVTGASGAFSIPVRDSWVSGSYSLSISAGGIIDVQGRRLIVSYNYNFPVVDAVNVSPIFLRQPDALKSVLAGQPVSLGVEVQGAENHVSYQWYRGEPGDTRVPIAGATNSGITITAAEDASYWVRAISAGLSSDSRGAAVVLVRKANIVAQPENVSVPAGAAAVFSVQVDVPATSVSYRWTVAGLTIAGATGPTLTLSAVTTDQAGMVFCEISNLAGRIFTAGAILSVEASSAPLRISQHPPDAVAAVGEYLQLQAAAEGNPPLSFLWQKDGVDLPEQRGGNLQLYPMLDSSYGSYRLRVTNGFEVAFSRAAVISPPRAPIIVTAPRVTSGGTRVGEFLIMSVEAIGATPMAYQWMKGGVAIAGATNLTLGRGPLQESDAGNYTLRVSNALGTTISPVFTLTVEPSLVVPAITRGPSAQAVSAGGALVLTVQATGSDLSYQWRKNGLITHSGTSATLLLTPAAPSDSGFYDVFVSNLLGRVGTERAQVTVIPQSTRPLVLRQPAAASAPPRGIAIFKAGIDGEATLRYQWRFNGRLLAEETDHLLGTRTETLYVLVQSAADAGLYDLVATNDAGSVTTNTAALTVLPASSAPVITQQPQGRSVSTGDQVSLSVAVVGSAPLSYQWLRPNGDVFGATSATLVLPAADLVSAGPYRVRVSNFLGTVTSDAAVVEVTVPPPAVPSRLLNLSVLTSVAGAGDSLSLGYVIGGAGTAGTKPLVIRAVGPSLAAFGVEGVLPDPRLELFAGVTKTGENDNWGGLAALASAMSRVGAFPFTSATSKDAAALVALQTPDNTVRLASADGQPGVVLAELYDATPVAEFTRESRRLLNVSVLKSVGGGVTAGFVISGDATKSVLVRAVGPALAQAPFSVSGVSVDPQLALFNGTTQIAVSGDWGKPQGVSAANASALTTAFAQVGAFPLPAGSRDAALIAELPPGSYTARVTGPEGVVLVEIYDLR